MKKIICLMCLVLCAAVLAGCGMNMNNVTKEPNFAGTVTEVHETYIMVLVDEGEDARRSSDLITVSRRTTLADGSPDLSIGDKVIVYYDGMIMESYPAQLGEVYAIVVTEHTDVAQEETEVNTSEDIYFELVDVTANSVVADLINNTEYQLSSGNSFDFALQVLENGEWTDVAPRADAMNTMELVGYEPGTVRINFDISRNYEPLPDGEYRLVKGFGYTNTSEDGSVLLAVEFTVKS